VLHYSKHFSFFEAGIIFRRKRGTIITFVERSRMFFFCFPSRVFLLLCSFFISLFPFLRRELYSVEREEQLLRLVKDPVALILDFSDFFGIFQNFSEELGLLNWLFIFLDFLGMR
jgi:hypothetical protein